MAKRSYNQAYEILSGVLLPEAKRGRPMENDDQLVARAKEGRRTNEYRSRNHAAVELSKDAKGASAGAKIKRLNRKFKTANID
jgi:hypothetical protein